MGEWIALAVFLLVAYWVVAGTLYACYWTEFQHAKQIRPQEVEEARRKALNAHKWPMLAVEKFISTREDLKS